LFLKILDRVRRRYGFVVLGYVVMPEHVLLLVSEPQGETLSSAGRERAKTAQRGNGSAMLASAHPMTAMAAAFWRSSCGTILSSVSAAV